MYSYKNNILEFIIINSYVVHIVIIICVLYIFTVYLLRKNMRKCYNRWPQKIDTRYLASGSASGIEICLKQLSFFHWHT